MASQRENEKSGRLVDVNASPPYNVHTSDALSTAPADTAEFSSLTASVLSSKEWNLMWSRSNRSVKSSFGRLKSHRIVRIELLSVESPSIEETYPLQSYEECFVKVFKPNAKTKVKMSSETISNTKIWSKGTKSVASNDLYDDDLSDDEDEIDSSVKSLVHKTDVPEGWRIGYVFPLASVKVNQIESNIANITLEHKFRKKHQNLIFNSRRDVLSFRRFLMEQKLLEKTRTKEILSYKITQRLPHFILQRNKKVNLLIEIVSAWDLPAVDRASSDPFVSVTFNGEEIHRTKHLSRTIDHAVWTVKTGSLFLLPVPISDFFRDEESFLFHVQDFNKVSDSESLGAVFLSPRELYEMNGERVGFALKPLPGNKDYGKGHIAIRCRQATYDDEEFMHQLNARKFVAAKNSIKASVSEKMGGRLGIKSTIFGNAKVDKFGEKAKMYRVRPSPDPSRKEDTTWMTQEQIEHETMQESQHWLETTVGMLGKVFVEVLGCDDLPDLDFGAKNKTDAFVAVIHEDSLFYTDVIDDCLSPRWLPWTKRAFVFNMRHTSSNVYVGVFDNDLTSDHDMIGRVSVDISNLRPNTTYTLRYNLYESARLWVEERKPKGSILLRVRIEVEDERQLLLSSIMAPAPTFYFNTQRKRDYKVVTQTCVGNLDMEQFGLDAIYGYTNEVYVYMNAIEKVYEAAESLIFWRSQMSVTLHGNVYSFPIHSLIAFLFGVILVERPFLFPAFFFGSVAWILIACMGYRRSIPKPWFHCRSFVEFFEILFFEKSSIDTSIEPGNNREEAERVDQEFIEFWGVETEEAAKKNSEETEEDYSDDEIEEVNVDISTKGNISPVLKLIKPYLDYIQDYLAKVCHFCRGVKNILIWEECYISFWITFGCLVLSFVSLFLPWPFILRWSSRITVWAGLGPWMRLVDVYYYTPWVKHENLSKDQLVLLKQERRKQREENIHEKRVLREDVMKHKAMKKIMFGNYITKIPVSKNDLYTDSPLPDSSAVPYQPGQSLMKTGYKHTNVPGQHLTGDVIPKIENVPIGEDSYHRLAIKKEKQN